MLLSDDVRKITCHKQTKKANEKKSFDEFKLSLLRLVSLELFQVDQIYFSIILVTLVAFYVLNLKYFYDTFTPWMGAFGIISLLVILVLGYTWKEFKEWPKLSKFRAYIIMLVIYSNLVFVFLQKGIHENEEAAHMFLNQKIACYVLIANLCAAFYRQTPWVFRIFLILLNLFVVILVCLIDKWTYDLFVIFVSSSFMVLNDLKVQKCEEKFIQELFKTKTLSDFLIDLLHDAKVGHFTFTNVDCEKDSACVGHFPQIIETTTHGTNFREVKGGHLYNDSIIQLKQEKISPFQIMDSLVYFQDDEEDNSNKESLKEKVSNLIKRQDLEGNAYTNLGLFQSKEAQDLLYNVQLKKNRELNSNEILLKEVPAVKVSTPNVPFNYKNILLAKISHEFKGPMMLIQNTIDLMLEKNEDIGLNDNLHKIKYLAEIVLLLILDISEFTNLTIPKQSLSPLNDNKISKIQKYKENLSVVEMRNLKEYLVNMCRVFCSIYDKNLLIQVIMDEYLQNSYVVIDDKKVKQILTNLLSNAVKFSIEGSSIKVTFRKNTNDEGARQSRVISLKICGDSPNYSDLSNSKAISLSRQFSEESEQKQFNKNFKSSIFLRGDSYSSKNKYNQHHAYVSGFTIFIEDSGNGLDLNTMEILNRDDKDKFHSNNFESAGIMSPIDFEDYLSRKGLGSGLLICKKLSYELGVDLKSMLLTDIPLANVPSARGTRFILNFPYEPQLTLDNTIETHREIILNSEDKNLLGCLAGQVSNYRIIPEISLEIKGNLKINDLTTFQSDTNYFLSDTLISKNNGNSFSNFLKISPIPKKISKFSQLLSYSSGKKRSTIVSSTEGLGSIQILENTHEDEESPERVMKFSNKKLEQDYNNNELPNFHRQAAIGLDASPTISTPSKDYIRKRRGSNSIPGIKMRRSASPQELRSRKYSIEEIMIDMGTKKTKPIEVESSQVEEDQVRDKILIIDDNGNYAKSIENLIKRYYSKNKNRLPRPFFTKILNDGIELVYEIYKELTTNDGRLQTRVIFSDQMMVYMNGSEAYTIIKNICKDKQLKEIPYIICSAFVDSTHKEKMKGNGINNVYQKPITMGNIEYILEEVMKDDFLS